MKLKKVERYIGDVTVLEEVGNAGNGIPKVAKQKMIVKVYFLNIHW